MIFLLNPLHHHIRISLAEIKDHDWVTMYGLNPLLKEEENCQLIEVRQISVNKTETPIYK